MALRKERLCIQLNHKISLDLWDLCDIISILNFFLPRWGFR
jgi:hypothetical protein